MLTVYTFCVYGVNIPPLVLRASSRSGPHACALACIAALAIPCVRAAGQQLSAAPCAIVSRPGDVERCLRTSNAKPSIPSVDPQHPYTLPELIDIAEDASPEARIAWVSARRSLESAGIDRAAYLPMLSLVAVGSDVRAIVPFPEPLAPRGYVTVEEPGVVAQLSLQYTLLDFGRGARVKAGEDRELAATLQLGRVQQQVATAVAVGYYRVQLAQGELDAAQQILKTAETVGQSAHAQLDNGRATLPDVENADAGVAEAQFELATATGAVEKAKLALTEAAGVEPTTAIELADDGATARRQTPAEVEELVHTAWRSRPDLMARMQQLNAATQMQRSARSAYLPVVSVHADGGQTNLWPTVDFGAVGPAKVPTWDASVEMRWKIFDGARRHEVAVADAEKRGAAEELRRQQDQVTREVWSAYVDYETALQQEHAAELFLSASQTSYDSSQDAFNDGVRTLVDVVQAEKQLAQARLAAVRAHATRLQSGVALGLATGRLTIHPANAEEVQP